MLIAQKVSELQIPFLDKLNSEIKNWIDEANFENIGISRSESVNITDHDLSIALLAAGIEELSRFSNDDQGRVFGHYTKDQIGCNDASYISRDGRSIQTEDLSIRRLDWLLENEFYKQYESNTEREHWDEPGLTLPSGPGPWGSGLVALGKDPNPHKLDDPFPGRDLQDQRKNGIPAWRTEPWKKIETLADAINHVSLVLDRSKFIDANYKVSYNFNYNDVELFEHKMNLQRLQFKSILTDLEV
ncbi:MAG: hypothetical protein MRY83_24620, partial [Flavobacteriales bacterium]|nr:hypothetical protein [Flavobacteriales bacterium]